MRKFVGIALGASLLAPAVAAQTSADLPGPAELYIERPFAKPEALARFRSYIDGLSQKLGRPVEFPDGFWEAAPTIEKWGYRFQKPSESSRYDLFFYQQYDTKPTFDAVVRTVGGLRKGGCSFYRAKNARMDSITLKRISASAEIDGKQRACGDYPWGGGWATDIADIGGDASASITFRVEPTAIPDGRFNGRILANDPDVHVDAKAQSIFGINTNSVAGQVLSVVVDRGNDVFGFARNPNLKTATEVLNIVNVDTLRFDRNLTLSIIHVAGENGAVSSSKYNSLMYDLKSARWSTQNSFLMLDPDTGFVNIGGKQYLQLMYKSTLRASAPAKLVYADVQREIDWLKGFQDGEQIYDVKRNDTLWSIAKMKYGNGFFHNLISGYNFGNRKVVLTPGQRIVLPPLYEFDVTEKAYFVRPGDTATSICRSQGILDVRSCLRSLRILNKGVRLSAIKALQPLVLPNTEITTPLL